VDLLSVKFSPFVDLVTIIEIALKPRPSLVDNFIGRRDVLEAMHQAHLANRPTNSKKSVISVLYGLGGAGKTQTALKFALEFEEKCVKLCVCQSRINMGIEFQMD
jgi:signal recognition particle GTPase